MEHQSVNYAQHNPSAALLVALADAPTRFSRLLLPTSSPTPQIRESIKSLFPDRDCFTLVRPVNDEDALARLDTLGSSQMRPEFREGLQRLTQLIFAKAQPKRLGAQILTGPMLAGLVEAYVGAINNGAVPTIATAWQVRVGRRVFSRGLSGGGWPCVCLYQRGGSD